MRGYITLYCESELSDYWIVSCVQQQRAQDLIWWNDEREEKNIGVGGKKWAIIFIFIKELSLWEESNQLIIFSTITSCK